MKGQGLANITLLIPAFKNKFAFIFQYCLETALEWSPHCAKHYSRGGTPAVCVPQMAWTASVLDTGQIGDKQQNCRGQKNAMGAGENAKEYLSDTVKLGKIVEESTITGEDCSNPVSTKKTINNLPFFSLNISSA